MALPQWPCGSGELRHAGGCSVAPVSTETRCEDPGCARRGAAVDAAGLQRRLAHLARVAVTGRVCVACHSERRGCEHAQVHPWVPRTWLASAREHGVLPLEYTFAPVERGAILGRPRHAPSSRAQQQARQP